MGFGTEGHGAVSPLASSMAQGGLMLDFARPVGRLNWTR